MRLISLVLSVAAFAGAQQPRGASISDLSFFNGSLAVAAAGDDALYVVSPRGARSGGISALGYCETPGVGNPPVSLQRIALAGSAPEWTACMRFRDVAPGGIVTDAGASGVVVAGIPSSGFPVSAGAVSTPAHNVPLSGPDDAEEIAVARIRPNLDVVFSAFLSSAPAENPVRRTPVHVAVLPDGSVFIARLTAAPGWPVTEDALAREAESGAYVVRLSADGTRVLYGSYVPGVTAVSGVAALPDGSALVAGQRSGAEGFLMRFRAGSTPVTTSLGAMAPPRIAVTPEGRVRVAASTSDSEILLAEYGPDLGDPVRLARHPFSLHLHRLGQATDGTWLLLAQGDQAPPPVLTNSPFRPNSNDETELLAFDPALLELTSVRRMSWGPAKDFAVTGPAEVAIATPSPILLSDIPFSTVPATDRLTATDLDPGSDRFHYTYPSVVEVCSAEPTRPALIWHWPVYGHTVEVHAASEDGPLVARGLAGSIPIPARSETYYFRELIVGKAIFGAAATTLRVETRALRCSSSDGAEVVITPNPVLGCSDLPGAAPAVSVRGMMRTPGVGVVRVNGASGPVLTAGESPLFTTTGDWVANGMEFALFGADSADKPLASARAYVVPNRSCLQRFALAVPMIRATSDCREPSRATLAYYTGYKEPVEIVAAAQSRTLAVLPGPSGLLDVALTGADTFQLRSLLAPGGPAAVWAQVSVDSAQRCGQGSPLP